MLKKPAIIAFAGGGLLVALLLAAFLFTSGGGASATQSQAGRAVADSAAPSMVSSAEANAWAEARAADTETAYKVYLAAFPTGGFSDDAHAAIARAEEEHAATTAPAQVTPTAARRRSRASVASSCRAYVDRHWPAPSRVTRTVGGAAGGCAVGLLAGGDDGRNCVVGAVAGGATGAVSAEGRERRRERELDRCMANGGPG